MTNKQRLLNKIRELGYDESVISYFQRRTVDNIQKFIDNEETLKVIAEAAQNAAISRRS
jgi:hypothetical protein